MNVENDSLKQIEQFKLKIKEKGIINQCLLEFFGLSADDIKLQNKMEGKTEEIYQILKEKNILTNKFEFRDFLETISHLWGMHEFKKEIKSKIESILIILQEDIKNLFSEKEIYSVFCFCRNNYILLILLEHNIISIDIIIKDIGLKEYANEWNKLKYFYPEIRKYDEKYLNQLITYHGYGLQYFVEENDQNLELYYEMRKDGVKEPKIVELIREDKIEEFILFIEHSPIDLNEKIQSKEKIFRTYKKNLTPIEYSALFGSVAIFKYLYLKNMDIIVDVYRSDIIDYAIQGRNYEIIHILEEMNKEALNNRPKKYIEVSIKMHYNEIFEYLITNLNIQITEEIIILIITYRNYHLFNQIIISNQIEFKDGVILTNIFPGICKFGNEEIVRILMNQPNLDINSKDHIFNHFVEVNKKKKKKIEALR